MGGEREVVTVMSTHDIEPGMLEQIAHLIVAGCFMTDNFLPRPYQDNILCALLLDPSIVMY